ncbi:PaiB family negative transcriptional regulator [Gelidibacter algens]|uniref:PaiB family negative transcriptional regulator n=1 Tax=Gelidibacter algens TaxID=49280 RepID=A0A1A7QNR8_9FLAO|nr:FMN-binding negative transcriptional regulator [Gelidibacter algens]OBX20983.1 transcriptional regulator [Gelidibacter algens]RAJ25125.1 PaiB family negative transcriptional regulator [Gelidibacter algens]
MYIPKINLETDRDEIISFMKQFSFATIITAKDGCPIATHLPFFITERDNNIILTSHFAKANEHWMDIVSNNVLVIFSEPHAYISTNNYSREMEVPTWNYVSIHAYGKGKLIMESEKVFNVLEQTIDTYESSYQSKWKNFPNDYKTRMVNGIMAFEILVTETQAKKKLSQNKTIEERQRIAESLSQTSNTNNELIAGFIWDGLLKKNKGK